MNTTTTIQEILPHTRRAFAVGVALALLVLAVIILASFLFVRDLVRHQIVSRDAEALHATTVMEQMDARSSFDSPVTANDNEMVEFQAALLASRLRGVLGIRFFQTNGAFRDAFPATIQPTQLTPAELLAAREMRPCSRYVSSLPLDEVFIYLPQFATGNVAHVPILQVAVPLGGGGTNGPVSGVAQFVVEGTAIAEEYRRLDKYLASLALVVFTVGSVLLVAMLWPAFQRMQYLNRQMAEHNEKLALANDQLGLSARAAALGAVSAHLMHGLKNPLASVFEYVRARSSCDTPLSAGDAQDALAAAQRMQSLVDETLEVLGDARGQPAYEITTTELLDTLGRRVKALADKAQVAIAVTNQNPVTLPSPVANQVRLILVNLLENAVQASPPGGVIRLTAQWRGERLLFRVADQGGGIAPEVQSSLFLPCKSTRPGGSGLGLTIARQIADHLKAKLALEESSAQGAAFVLDLPLPSANGNSPRDHKVGADTQDPFGVPGCSRPISSGIESKNPGK